MDLLSALADEVTGNSGRGGACLIQRWLDSIPAETPGRDELAATLSTTDPDDQHYRTLSALDRLTRRLGLATSIKSIAEHRRGNCRCEA